MRYAELIVKQCQRIGHSVKLKRGLSPRTLQTRLNRFLKSDEHPVSQPCYPKSLPKSLIDLYAWHNGADGEFIPFHDFVDLDQAFSWWDVVSEAVEDSTEYGNGNVIFADTSIFPFMIESGGNMVVMDVGKGSKTRGSIGYFANNGDSSVRNEFKTLNQFLRAHYQCFKDDIYYVTEIGLDYDERDSTLASFRSGDSRTA